LKMFHYWRVLLLLRWQYRVQVDISCILTSLTKWILRLSLSDAYLCLVTKSTPKSKQIWRREISMSDLGT
jgi:hypothetical protein